MPAQRLLGEPLRQRQRMAVEAARRVTGQVPAGLAAGPDAELGGRQAEQLELAVVGVAVAAVGRPDGIDARSVGCAQESSLDAAARGRSGGAQPEPVSYTHLRAHETDS